MLGKLGVELQVQKDTLPILSRVVCLKISAKIIFQNSNETITEKMKNKFAPLIEEYNKKTLIAIRTCNQFFLKKFHSLNSIFFSRFRCALKLGVLKIKLLTRCILTVPEK